LRQFLGWNRHRRGYAFLGAAQGPPRLLQAGHDRRGKGAWLTKRIDLRMAGKDAISQGRAGARQADDENRARSSLGGTGFCVATGGPGDQRVDHGQIAPYVIVEMLPAQLRPSGKLGKGLTVFTEVLQLL
jgi:hypothetical protein